ncbi:hypothetical protein [Roseibium album]|uniref:hypothetical protein n=1 Tax=Roseibium album TaxID=311410 RepID=UPI0024913209|nr:hypothetical protein [Roseibium album]
MCLFWKHYGRVKQEGKVLKAENAVIGSPLTGIVAAMSNTRIVSIEERAGAETGSLQH